MPNKLREPLRTCVGCGQRALQRTLLCMQSMQDGTLSLTALPARRAGRAAYLHREPGCWQTFASRKGMIRSLRRNIDREVRRAFIEQLSSQAGGVTCGSGPR